MIKRNNDIARIRRGIADCLFQPVGVTVRLGRNKTLRFCGTLSGVYPALFTVQPDDKTFLGKTAYSYSDVLCGTVTVRPAKAMSDTQPPQAESMSDTQPPRAGSMSDTQAMREKRPKQPRQ